MFSIGSLLFFCIVLSLFKQEKKQRTYIKNKVENKILILNPFGRDIFLIRIYPFYVSKKTIQSIKLLFISYVAIWPINLEWLLLFYKNVKCDNFTGSKREKKYKIDFGIWLHQYYFRGLYISRNTIHIHLHYTYFY